ncbi:MAG: hypothetical protein KDA96_15315 [Planctomycetaceae bacterium]|nr:hypothetical protein [Planctomycetaceae bacterium]
MSDLAFQKTTEVPADRQLTLLRSSPSESLLACGGFDGTIRWWLSAETSWAEQTAIAGHHGWVSGVEFSADGQLLLSADSWGSLQCRRRTGEGWEPVWSADMAHDGWIRQLRLTSDSATCVTTGRDGWMRRWNTSDGRLLQEQQVPGADLLALAIHPDGTVVTGDHRGIIRTFPPDTGSPSPAFDAAELFLEHRLQDVGGVRGIRFNREGTQLAAWGTRPKNGGNVQGIPVALLFDWSSGERLHVLEMGTASDVYVTDLEFHPDGFLIATTSGNPGTGRIVCMRPGETEPFLVEKSLANSHSLSLQTDGSRVIVVSTNRNSNGNGRRLNDDGTYPGNYSLLTEFSLAPPSAA